MPILNALNNFKSKILQLAGRKKSLNSVSMDELAEQRVLLDRQEEEQLQRIQKLEQQKDALFDQAKKEKDPRRQQRAAAKIASCVREVKQLDIELTRLRKEIRLISGLEHVKRKAERATGSYSKVVAGMSVADLSSLIDKATIDDQLNQEKLDDLLDTMDEGLELAETEGSGDELEQDILSQIQAAQADDEEAATTTPAATKSEQKKRNLNNFNKEF